MNAETVKGIFESIAQQMTENCDYLVELDQQNGDGDLGISMSGGFRAVADTLEASAETDLGRLLLRASQELNEAAPSSLGTILSIGLMGMARALRGKERASLEEAADALQAGLDKIMEKAGSKPGEKTILDALCPAVTALRARGGEGVCQAVSAAAEAAAKGSESTRQMRSVHGRAAYYGDRSIGLLDGGSVVGRLIFEGICQYCCR